MERDQALKFMHDLLRLMLQKNGSDLFITAGFPPAIKVDGRIVPQSNQILQPQHTTELARAIMNDRQAADFETHKECNFGISPAGIGRFRANAFVQQGRVALVLRTIPQKIPNFKELGLPPVLTEIALAKRGLVIFVGGTGTGKTTSLASLVDYRNENTYGHIITIEDPIEFVHQHKNCIVSQREIGIDTESFATGLKAAMREAPDVIMVGEIRDHETMSAVLSAAETGHLVLTTLHTVNAIQTVERIQTFFPPHQHDLVRLQLATVLAGVASQRLLPCLSSSGMVPAVELLMATPRVRELVLEGKTLELDKALQEGQEYYGTQTFNMSLKSHYEGKLISLEDALAASDNPDDLKLQIRGIQTGVSASRLQVTR